MSKFLVIRRWHGLLHTVIEHDDYSDRYSREEKASIELRVQIPRDMEAFPLSVWTTIIRDMQRPR